MALEITNIKTDKEKYIFWEDKEIKLSFEVISHDKEYKLNSVNIEYWIQYYLDWNTWWRKSKNITISQDESFYRWESKKYSYSIPIEYPNLKIWEYDYLWLNVKNYIKIIADIKLNPFDCKKEYFPNITLKEESINTLPYNEWDIISKWALDLYEQIEKLKTYTNKEKFDEIQKQIDDLYWDENYPDNSDEIDVEIEILEEEQEKHYYIADTTSFETLKGKIQDQINLKYWYWELKNKENKENFIAITNWYFWKDYVSKDFYEYLLKNYLLFKISRIFPISINIIYTWGLLWIMYFLFDYYQIEKSIMFFPGTILIILFSTLDLSWLKKIKNEIIKINFKNKNTISEKILSKQLKFDDIFDTIDINYNEIYSCNFSANLKCKISFTQTVWKQTHTYSNFFWSIDLWNYNWNQLTLRNINKIENLDILNNIFIQPWKIWNNSKISYILSYNFSSPELIDKDYEIEIN